MNRDSTLLILTPGFPSDESDTTCIPAHQGFVRAINRAFPELKVVIMAIQYPYRKDQYDWHGNEVIALNAKRIPKPLRPLFWIRTWARLQGIKAQTRLVGVLSFWCLEEALIGSFFCKWSRIRHVSWISGQDARRSNRYFRLIAPKPQELAAMSPFLADEVQRNFDTRPAYIIANGIDASRHQAPIAVRTIDVLGVGSLIPLKQYSIFVETIGKLMETNRYLKVVICGAGPEKDMLHRMIDDLNLGENITLAGELPNAEVLQLMQRSKILLHPSSYEGYGSVILEALYSGCHVVSFVKSEKTDVAHWHIVGSRDEMVNRCQQLLTHETDFTCVVARDINESARSMMSLFGYSATV